MSDTRIPRHISWPAAAVVSLGLWGLMGWLGYLVAEAL